MTATELNNYVAQFVHEAVKQDRCTPYPPNCLYQIVVAIGLLNIVYFYNCILFGLRAGDEHRSLCVNQFCFGVSNGSEYVQFNGHTSKTYMCIIY